MENSKTPEVLETVERDELCGVSSGGVRGGEIWLASRRDFVLEFVRLRGVVGCEDAHLETVDREELCGVSGGGVRGGEIWLARWCDFVLEEQWMRGVGGWGSALSMSLIVTGMGRRSSSRHRPLAFWSSTANTRGELLPNLADEG